MIRLTACFAIAWILSAGAAGADAFDRFLERFHGFRTLEARFSQSVQTPLGIEQASGRIWIRRPHLMRWDYQDPEPKIFLLRKNEYRMYTPAERQMVIQKIERKDDEIVLRGVCLKPELASTAILTDSSRRDQAAALRLQVEEL